MALPLRSLTPAAPDPILGLSEAFRADKRPNKVNLSVGVYVDDSGVTPVIPSVLDAERRLLAKAGSKGYLPIDGRPAYKVGRARPHLRRRPRNCRRAGDRPPPRHPVGTGALRVAADFLLQTGSSKTIWLSEPTWPNHPQLFALAGFALRTYPYLDDSGRRIDVRRMLAALRTAVPGDVVLLHGSCHNPSGVDPDPETWAAIAEIIVERELLPIVDFAYQGFGFGLREDADWLAGLARPGLEFLVCYELLEELRPLQRTRRGADPRRGRSGPGGRGPKPPQDRDPLQLLQPAGARRRHRRDDPYRPGPAGPMGGGPGRDAQPHPRQPGRPRGRRSTRRACPATGSRSAASAACSRCSGLSADQVARLRDEFAVYVVEPRPDQRRRPHGANLPHVVESVKAVIEG